MARGLLGARALTSGLAAPQTLPASRPLRRFRSRGSPESLRSVPATWRGGVGPGVDVCGSRPPSGALSPSPRVGGTGGDALGQPGRVRSRGRAGHHS